MHHAPGGDLTIKSGRRCFRLTTPSGDFHMPRQFWIVPVTIAIAFTLFFATLTSFASFSFQHPMYPKARIVEKDGALIVKSTGYEADPENPPIVDIGPTHHEFGVMPPSTRGVHVFKIRNAGTGPLRLTRGATTCKCTFAGVPGGLVQPGQEAEIRLVWNTGLFDDYRQVAEIRTNDPKTPKIHLEVTGKVEVRHIVEPKEMIFSRMEPDTPYTARILACSRRWESFRLDDLTCTLEGTEISIEPASQEVLNERHAKSGYWISVTLPPSGPGRVHSLLQGKMTPTTVDEEPESIEVEIAGHVLRRLSLIGSAIVDESVVLDVLPEGKGKETRLIAKVSDKVTDLEIRDIKAEPSFLEVSMQPLERSTRPGVYEMRIAVPDTAPLGSYMGARHGKLEIEFEHPRIERLKLDVQFAVVKRVAP